MPELPDTENSIRQFLGKIKGQRVIEVTCDDDPTPMRLVFDGAPVVADVTRIYLHFEDGSTATFYALEDQLGFNYDGESER